MIYRICFLAFTIFLLTSNVYAGDISNETSNQLSVLSARSSIRGLQITGFRNSDLNAIEVATIDRSSANDLFKKIAIGNDLATEFNLDGCYARAHLIAVQAEQVGIKLGKAFVAGNMQIANIKGQLLSSGGNMFSFMSFHVAAFAIVADPNGNKELTVFDPVFFSQPISMQMWLNFLDAKIDPAKNFYTIGIHRIYLSNRFQFISESEPIRSSWESKEIYFSRYLLQKYSAYVHGVKNGTVNPGDEEFFYGHVLISYGNSDEQPGTESPQCLNLPRDLESCSQIAERCGQSVGTRWKNYLKQPGTKRSDDDTLWAEEIIADNCLIALPSEATVRNASLKASFLSAYRRILNKND